MSHHHPKQIGIISFTVSGHSLHFQNKEQFCILSSSVLKCLAFLQETECNLIPCVYALCPSVVQHFQLWMLSIHNHFYTGRIWENWCHDFPLFLTIVVVELTLILILFCFYLSPMLFVSGPGRRLNVVVFFCLSEPFHVDVDIFSTILLIWAHMHSYNLMNIYQQQ